MSFLTRLFGRPQAAPAAPTTVSTDAQMAAALGSVVMANAKSRDAAGTATGRAARLTSGLTPEIMASYLDEFYQGRFRNIAMLWDAMQDGDTICAPVAEKRLSKIVGELRDYTVDPVDDSPAAKKQAEFLRTFFESGIRAEHGRCYNERGGLRKAAEFICDAVGKKYAFLAKVWEREGDQLRLRLRFIPLWHMREEEDGSYTYCPNPNSTASAARVKEEEWVIAVRRRAVMQAAGLAVLLRRLPVQQIARVLERYGVPPVYGETNAEMGSPGWTALYSAVQAITSGWSAVVSEGTKINLVENKFNAAALHKIHLEACTTEVIINWLGGELGTVSKSGSGTLAGGAQADDLDDIVRDDCDWLSEVIQEQIAVDALARKFPGQPVLARFRVRKPDDMDDKADMEILTGAVKLGAQVPVSYLANRFGIPAAVEGDAVLVIGQSSVVGGQPATTVPADGSTAADGATVDTAAIQAVALNGAQVQSLLEVIQQVALRQLPREAAVQIVISAFGIDAKTADALLGDVGRGFFVDPATAVANARANALRYLARAHAGRKARVRDRRPDLDELAANAMQPVGTAYAGLLQPLLEQLAALPADATADQAAAILDAYQIPEASLDGFGETMQQVTFAAAMMGGEPIRKSGQKSVVNALPGMRRDGGGHWSFRCNATATAAYAPLPFEEARAFWAAKDLIEEFAGDEFQQDIWIQSRVTGFKVAGITSETLLRQVHADLDRAIKGEATVGQLTRTLRDKYGLGAKHAETVVRTNVQSAYSWGNWQQLSAPSVVQAFPLLAFDVTEDERTSGICAPLANKAYPREHPIWASMYPPNHYNCRTTVFPTTAEEAAEEGFEVMAPDAIMRTDMGTEILPAKEFTGNIGTGRLADIIPED